MKKLLLAGALVLLVAAGCSKGSNTASNNAPAETSATTDTQTNTTPTPPKKTPPTPSQGYTQALRMYGTNRIQFDDVCTATPSQVVFKSGTKVLIDNRGEAKEKITIGTTVVTVAGYGYTVVTIPTVTAQKVIYGSCGAKKNVLTITINK